MNRKIWIFVCSLIFGGAIDTAICQVSGRAIFSVFSDQILKKKLPVGFQIPNSEKWNMEVEFSVVSIKPELTRAFFAEQPIEIQKELMEAGIFVIKTTPRLFFTQILLRPEIVFADYAKMHPKTEIIFNQFNHSVNKIDLAKQLFPDDNGRGVKVSVKEYAFDTADIDLHNRHFSQGIESNRLDPHASFMATAIAGGGNTFYTGTGVAPAAEVSSSNFIPVLPDDAKFYDGVAVQNHSYGVDIENYYGAEAYAFDVSAIQNPKLLHVFSAGNAGTKTATSGIYAGIAGFANLTGNFKMTKNSLVVGAVDSFYNVLPFSSRGPAYDGRIKPDLVAFGQNGASEAAALVSGMVAILQTGSAVKSSLVKAAILNAADDVGVPGPDFQTGFGNLNAANALRNFRSDTLSGKVEKNEAKKILTMTFPEAGIFKATLVWNDPAAEPNAEIALVNDLDFQIHSTKTGETWLPWVLDSYPDAVRLSAPAARGRDSLNNVEQISFKVFAQDDIELTVSGRAMKTASQDFAIAFSFEPDEEHFIWTNPFAGQKMEQQNGVDFRWAYNGQAPFGKLEYQFKDAGNWLSIDDAVDLQNGVYVWKAPRDTTAAMTARMIVGNDTIETVGDFYVINPLELSVGFACPDSFLVSWLPKKNVLGYRIFKLGEFYLDSLVDVTDTFFVKKMAHPDDRFIAVTPILPGKKNGVLSYTVDAYRQGAGCYVKLFVAAVTTNNDVELLLQLGSDYNVEKVLFEKRQADGSFVQFIETTELDELNLIALDIAPKDGLNQYRALITLINGAVIGTDVLNVYVLKAKDFLVFPNPIGNEQELKLLTKTEEPAQLKIYDLAGRLLYEIPVGSRLESVSTEFLQPGVYFVSIWKNGKNVFTEKFLKK